MNFYLASASPRRKAFLEQLGYAFEVLKVDVEEKHNPAESAVDYVRRLSQDKSAAGIAVRKMNYPVLGADTIVVCDGQILEKPKDFLDYQAMLSMLSGGTHQVITAVSVGDESKMQTCHVTTQVWFKALTEAEILNYWQSGEPLDKAGGYGIQGVGGRFVTRIDGSFHAVVGLPLYETDLLLAEFQK